MLASGGCGQALWRLVLHHPSVTSNGIGRPFCVLLWELVVGPTQYIDVP